MSGNNSALLGRPSEHVQTVGYGAAGSVGDAAVAAQPSAGLYAYSERVDSWVVRTAKPVSYEVRVADGLFDFERTDLLAPAAAPGKRLRRFVVLDSDVDLLHGNRIRAYFDYHDVEHVICVVPADETVKSFETAARIVEELDAFGVDRRREPLIVIGGGVLMDIVGLASSLYRRGTPFIRVPTTLIGLVDAGVGAKTGVNFNGHKNRLGTYFPADLTLLDRTFLATLDRRHIGNGLAEILKIALIKDARLFDLLESHGPLLLNEKFQGESESGEDAAREVVHRAIQGMLEELQPNLWETKLERSVDYGHTFSPTVEMRALPALLHGEAVCVDMALTTALARRRGLIDDADARRVYDVMHGLELPAWDDLLDQPELLTAALLDTVRHRNGQQRLPLPVGIGDVTFVNDVTERELLDAVAELRVAGRGRDLVEGHHV
ncbi:sedoheptulose 7-phosphate cyclase [Streptomyces sp. Je 1-369]|uniref:sedoheptulose 7-phosphate cyclase n=1 Tax=Streptomyces sp. Je 1-369 TaxID=2966192 RepID=UPI0022854D4B|nr:sedoheptulose 7-phosphate cyclase [Streptomyces sp. Je 1-369]WAL97151.1 sedoheptulose 7-phosphate cyclase [Streptomyces sp. Je 1-369]